MAQKHRLKWENPKLESLNGVGNARGDCSRGSGVSGNCLNGEVPNSGGAPGTCISGLGAS